MPAALSVFGVAGLAPSPARGAHGRALSRYGAIEAARSRLIEELIRRFHACLEQMPPELATVLELRGGAEAPGPLTRAALAAYLHTSTHHVAVLEARAVRRLAALVRAHRCAEAHAASTSLSILSGFEPPLAGSGGLPFATAAGSVAAERFAAPGARHAARLTGSSSAAGFLPPVLRPGENLALVVLILVGLAALLLAALLFGDRLALALRDRHWRSGGPRGPRR